MADKSMIARKAKQDINNIVQRNNVINSTIPKLMSKDNDESKQRIDELRVELEKNKVQITEIRKNVGLKYGVWKSVWDGKTFQPTSMIGVAFDDKAEAEKLLSQTKVGTDSNKERYDILDTIHDDGKNFMLY